jgi:succinyl-diaminopimelate desuccinylase
MRGGMNVNSVPDEARFGLDIRTVAGLDEQEVMKALHTAAGGAASFTLIGSNPPVWSNPHDAWVESVFAVMERLTGQHQEPAIATYYTDAGALTEAYGHPPALILGPGEPEQAHQTDEWCSIDRIETAAAAFTEITRAWCGL